MSIKDKTFKTRAEALAHAKKLLADGEITKKDFDRVKKELADPEKMSMDEYAVWRKSGFGKRVR